MTGDSFLAGFSVDQERILPRTLEAALASRGVTGEVSAFSAVGYSTALERIALEQQILPLAPDVVVVCFFQNDPWDNSRELNPSPVPGFEFGPEGRLVRVDPPASEAAGGPRAKGSWKRRSRLYSWQKKKVAALELAWKRWFRSGIEALPKVYHPLAEPLDPAIEKGWRITLALLAEMRDLASRQGIRLAIMDIPLQEAVVPARLEAAQARYPAMRDVRFAWGRSRERLLSFCREEGIPYLELAPALARCPDPGSLFLAEDGHFTEAGHRRVGEILAEWLIAEGLVPAAGTARPADLPREESRP